MRHDALAFMRHHMKVRLAKSPDEVRVAQRLRFHVFHEEGGAVHQGEQGIDQDRFDSVSEHLLVIEPSTGHPSPFAVEDGTLVGTYRLITQDKALGAGGFYSAAEFDLQPLLQRHRNLRFLELGRSCVLKRARGTAVIELLWQGIWNFVRIYKIDVMLGCASFDGIDPAAHKSALSFLARKVQTPEDWHVKALPERFHDMNLEPEASYDAKRVLASLPPLIKGYLRLGCYFGEGCVIDHAFNTVDVLVVLPVSAINPRYFARFGAPV